MSPLELIAQARETLAKQQAPKPEPILPDPAVPELRAAVETAQSQVEDLKQREKAAIDQATALLDKLNQNSMIETLRSEVRAAGDRYNVLQANLDHEATQHRQTQSDLVSERLLRQEAIAQLTREREAFGAMNARLEQAIKAASERPQLPEPPVYELLVTGRDINQRAEKIILKPKGAK